MKDFQLTIIHSDISRAFIDYLRFIFHESVSQKYIHYIPTSHNVNKTHWKFKCYCTNHKISED